MAVLPIPHKIASTLLLALVLVIIAQEQVITTYLGLYLGVGSSVIIGLGFLYVRKVVEDIGLTKGDLQTAEQVDNKISFMIPAKEPTTGPVVSEPITTDPVDQEPVTTGGESD